MWQESLGNGFCLAMPDPNARPNNQIPSGTLTTHLPLKTPLEMAGITYPVCFIETCASEETSVGAVHGLTDRPPNADFAEEKCRKH